MLQDLIIKNGVMTPKYDVYNNIYSVTVDEDTEELKMTYDVIEGSTINVTGNHDFQAGENVVYIDIFNGDDKETITLYVKKEKAEVVSNFDYTLETIEVVKPLPEYVAPLISMVCFLIILITFVLLFAKKKKRIRKSN